MKKLMMAAAGAVCLAMTGVGTMSAFAEETASVKFVVTSSGMSLHGFGTMSDDDANGPYDVYLAYAKKGETLPAATCVWKGWANDFDSRFNMQFGGLASETEYSYTIYATDRTGATTATTSGTFKTGKIYYVNGTSGDDTNDGLSEATAVKTPEQAMTLALAVKNLGHEIRIAPGTYVMSATLAPSANYALVGTGATAADVVLDANYAADQRIVDAIARHVSLSNLTFAHARRETSDNKWSHVGAAVRFGNFGINTTTTDDYYSWVSNCVFSANTNVNTGAGALFLSAGGKVTDCRFENNYAGNGANNGCGMGGAVVAQSNSMRAEFTRCTFVGNVSSNNYGAVAGGGNGDNTTTNGVVLLDCVFTNNAALTCGGTIGGKIILAKGCTFVGNTAPRGGILSTNYRAPKNGKFPWASRFEDCTFRANHAAYVGGVIGAYNNGATGFPFAFSNCTFEANSSAGGCSVFCYADLDLRDCVFRSNENDGDSAVRSAYGNYGWGDGLANLLTSTMRNCVFSNNVSRGSGMVTVAGNYLLDMDGCVFKANQLTPLKDASDDVSRATLWLSDNTSGSHLRNSLFADNTNTCGYACALYVGSTTATNDNLTIVGNRCTTTNVNSYAASGICVKNKASLGSVYRNCLVIDNTDIHPNAKVVLQNFYQWSIGTFQNCLEDGEQLLENGKSAMPGITRIAPNYKDTAMKFRDAASGDYTPTRRATAYNAGALLEWMTADAKDVLGNKRVFMNLPDIGAFENNEKIPGLMLIIR